jgi:radical SAM superfamily enzyme YgiQ (UPF0313 family)
MNLGRIVSIESSRGCPYNCSFCYVSSNKNLRIWRALSAKKTVERIEIVINELKADGVDFIDYNFFVNLKRVKKIITLLRKERIDMIWCTESLRIDLAKKMTHSFLNLLEESGLRWVAIGVESGSERILKLLRKGITIKDVININRKLKKHKLITPQYNFMAGIPTETPNDLKKTTDLMLKLLEENPRACFQPLSAYTPYPGTDLFNLAVEFGFKPPDRLENWAILDYPTWLFHIPWLNEKEKKKLQILYFSSLFIDKKADLRLSGGSLATLSKLFSHVYSPIARFRLKNHFVKFAPEINLIKKLFY